MATLKTSKAICSGGIIQYGVGDARTSHLGQNGESHTISNTTDPTYRSQVLSSFTTAFAGANNYTVTVAPTSYFETIWNINSADDNG